MIRATARTEAAYLTVVGLLILIAAAAATAAPRLGATRFDEAVRQHVATGTDGARALAVRATTGRDDRTLATDAQVADLGSGLRASAPPEMRRVIGGSEYWAATANSPILGRDSQHLVVGRSDTADGHIRYVSGRPPVGASEIGVAAAAARKVGVKPGDLLRTQNPATLAVRVVGLYGPRDPRDPYWRTHPELSDAMIIMTPGGGEYTLVTGLIAAGGYQALHLAAPLTITWTYTPDAARVTAARAGLLAAAIGQERIALADRVIAGTHPQFMTGLDRLLDEIMQRVRAARTVLSLALTGLFAVAIGVIVLACRLLVERMRPALAIMRARGASARQVGVLVAGVVALPVVPAVIAGYGAAVLAVRGPALPVSWLAVLVALAAAAVVVPVAGAMRGRAADARTSARRLVVEGLVVVLAVAATYLLRRRGVTTADPLLSAVPVLLGLACGLVALRIYPYPLRLVGRMARRARGAVPLVAVARAAGQGVISAVPLTVLLLATAVAGFAATMDASLARAQRDAAWQVAGADMRVDAPELTAAQIGRLARVPGVRGVVPARVVESANLRNGANVDAATLTMIGVDLDAYRRLVAGTPLRPPRLTGNGALFSPAAAGFADGADLSLTGQGGLPVAIHNAGVIQRFPGQESADEFVVVPSSTIQRAGGTYTSRVFVRGHPDPRALARAVPGARVVGYAATLRGLTGSGLVGLLHAAFGYGAFVMDVLCALTILFALMLGERGRRHAVAYLRALGLSRGQARWLAVGEFAPALLAAAAAGWLLGLLLPRIVGPGLDLRPYTDGIPVTRYVPGLTSTVLSAAGLVVLATGAMLAAASRPSLGIGDQR